MSKKAILGTLLASATLLSAAGVSYADTSDIKAESKKITITKDNAKLYKDSKMKESTTAKKGAVYQVDGYRNINGKHVYRLYQKDKYDKNQYKGYLVSTDAKELKSETAKGQYVAKKGATMWENFYWNNKREVTNQEKVFFAKYSYILGDGVKYYSMYYKNDEGKDTWAGYTNASNVQELKATEESKYVTLKKDYNTWANLYFKQHKDDFKAEKGVNFKVKRYYTLNGNKFYSTYRTDANGKEVWTGYVNGYSSVIEDLKAEKVAEKDQKVQVIKDYNTYKNHFFNKKEKLVKGKDVTIKVTYTYGNGKKYASLYDGETWLGYANVDAVKSTTALTDAEKVAQDAIKVAQEKLNGDQVFTKNEEKAVQDAIKAAQDAVKAHDVNKVDAVKDATDKLNKAVSELKTVVFDLSHWKYEDKDSTITLTQHTDKEHKDITIPGEVKGKQIIITTDQAGHDSQNFWSGVKDLKEVKFEKRNGKTVQSGNSLARLFWGQTALSTIDLTNLNTEKATDMHSMFDGTNATAIKFGDQFNTSNVINMKDMFHEAKNVKSLDLTSFDTAKVSKMTNMFALMSNVEEIKFGDKFNTANVESMYGMFYKDEKLKSIDSKNWNVSNVTNMSGMFEGCKVLAGLDMSKWQLPTGTKFMKVNTNLVDMFVDCKAFNKTNVKLPTDTNTKDAIKQELIRDLGDITSVKTTELQQAINILEQIDKTFGADKLKGDGDYQTVLDNAKATLKAAKNGAATNEEIKSAIESIKTFVDGLTLDNSDLDKLVDSIKESASKVYLTKAQEEKIDEFVKSAKKVTEDNKLSNYDKLKEINANAEKAQKFIADQPTEKDVQGLIDAIKEEQEIETAIKSHGSYLFDGWDDVEEKDKSADKMLEEIKKDDKDGNNNADQKYTAKEVQKAAGELNQAMNKLTVNATNTKKFVQAAQEKINKLIDNTEAQADLDKFEAQLKSDHSINNYEAIIITAKKVVSAIESAKTSSQGVYKSLDEAIAKAKPYNGGKTTNNPEVTPAGSSEEVTAQLAEKSQAPNHVKPYYEAGTYDKFATALVKAVEIKQATMADNAPKKEKEAEQPVYHKAEVEEATKALTEATEGLRFNKTAMTTINTKAEKYVKEYVSTLGVVKRAQKAVNDLNETLADDADMKPTQENKQTLRDQENMVVTKVEELKTKDVAKQATADKLKAGLDQAKPAYETQTADAGSGDAKQSYQIFDKTTNEAFRKAFVDSSSTYERLSKEDATKDSDVANDLKELKEKGEGLHLNQKALDNAITRAQKFYNGTLPKVEKQAEEEESAEKKALKLVIDEANTFKSEHAAYFTSTVTKENATAVNQELGKLYDATKAYEKSLTTITTDEAVLKDAPKLARIILTSNKSSSEAKELAKVVDAAYQVDKNSTGNEEKNIAKIDINKAWTDFGGSGHGSYYNAMKDLQDYARNTSSVDSDKLSSDNIELTDDMNGLRVLTNDLENAMKQAEQAESKAEQTKIATTQEQETIKNLIFDAKVIVESKTDSRRGIDNWKNINELTKKLKDAVKSLVSKK